MSTAAQSGILGAMKRRYKLISQSQIAKHKVDIVLHGNGTNAIRQTDDDYQTDRQRKDRAYYITKKSEGVNTLEYIQSSLEQIAERAVQVLGNLIESDNEQIQTKNVHYALDHIRGKAVNRNININAKTNNIESLLG